jgi:AcrR family transcriptional regulator
MLVNRNRRVPATRGVARALAGRESRLEELRDRRVQEHEALLRAARRVFLRRGYQQTRVEDILREAGISTRAFYRFHAGKGELFLELFDRANQAAMRRLRDSVAAHEDPAAQLDAYVAGTLELAYDSRLRRETSLFADVPAELTEQYAHEVDACREQLVSILWAIVARGGKSGAFRAPVCEDDAWALHGALGATMSRVLRADSPPARIPLERRLRRFCRAALGAPPEPARPRRPS